MRNRTTKTIQICLLLPLASVATMFPSAARSADEPIRAREESVTYESSCLELAAALILPEAEGRVPGAVILQGSGDSDRTNLWARSIAEGLAARGIAVLLTDKRGTGASQGDWHDADFEDLAEDAMAGARYLRSRPEIDPDAVGYLGLSQGGHVAPFAASLDRKTAFVVSVSAAATDLAEQMRHEMRNTFRQAGLPEAGVEAGMRIQDLAESYVRTGEWEPYAQALQIASQTELAPVAAGFPQTEDSWVWNWVRRVAHSDPIPFWRQVPAPILVAYGSEDEQDNVPVAESVRRLEVALEGRAAPWKVRVFEGSGHALYEPEGDGHVIRRDFLELAAETIHSRPSPRHRE